MGGNQPRANWSGYGASLWEMGWEDGSYVGYGLGGGCHVWDVGDGGQSCGRWDGWEAAISEVGITLPAGCQGRQT